MPLRFRLVKRLPSFLLDVELESIAPRLVLFGPSGSGKSLTLQCLAGLVDPDSGQVQIGDRCLFDRAQGIDLPPEGRRVGYVPQSGALFPHLSVTSNVGYALRRLPATAREARVSQLLDQVRLPGFESRRPSQLSGGEQQRVALARALAVEPDLLLLAEPFSALDAPVRGLLRQEVLDLQVELGFSWVFVTHDLEEAYLLADEIAVYDGGKILQSGPRDQVFHHPRTVEVARLMAVRNIIPVIQVAGDRLRLTPTGPELAVLGAGESRNTSSYWACIRQEDVRIVSPGSPATDSSGGTLLTGTVTEVRQLGFTVSLRFAIDSDVATTELWVEMSMQAYRSLDLASCPRRQVLVPREAVHLIPRPAP